MRRLYCFTLLSLILVSCNDSAVEPSARVFDGDVALNSQQALDEFASEGYEVIRGSLRIESEVFGDAPITDLSGLGQLDSVLQVLRIKNTAIHSLKGLEQLRHVGIAFEVSNNPQLRSLEGLKALASVGDLIIGSNERLESLQGVGSLGGRLQTLWIGNNYALSSLDGLQLQTETLANITIIGNAQLREIDALGSLSKLGSINLIRNNQMSSIEGLSALSSLRQLSINNNAQLLDFCPLRKALASPDFEPIYFNVHSNAYNPDFGQIMADDCRP